ncbi:MAG: ion transporter, partial [Cellvibrionales bacterium]|nr:ion transporter [Cellvibrionales bacterium]
MNISPAFNKLQSGLLVLKNNRYFELFVIFIIIVSALEIGAKTYSLPSYLASFFHYLDTFVTLFFMFEISVRFIAEPNKKHFFKNGWNIFDTLV